MGNYYPESKVEVRGFTAKYYDTLYPFYVSKNRIVIQATLTAPIEKGLQVLLYHLIEHGLFWFATSINTGNLFQPLLLDLARTFHALCSATETT